MGRITSSKKQMKGDPRHNSMLASKFINCLMLDGKKTVAQKVFYDALEEISRRDGADGQAPIEVFAQAPPTPSENPRTAWLTPTRRSHTSRGDRLSDPPSKTTIRIY